MTKDGHTRSANQPEQGADGRSIQTQGHGDDDKTSIQLGRGGTQGAEFEITTLETADQVHTGNDQDDVEEQCPVGEQSVDAQHAEDDSIVAREVAEVIVDSRLHLAKIGRLGDTLEVEELRDGLEVGEAASDAAGSQALKALRKVQARRNNVQGDLNASHCDGVGKY